jgi:hypothetical protein
MIRERLLGTPVLSMVAVVPVAKQRYLKIRQEAGSFDLMKTYSASSEGLILPEDSRQGGQVEP